MLCPSSLTNQQIVSVSAGWPMQPSSSWHAFPLDDTLQILYQCMLQQAVAPGKLAANTVVDLPWYKVTMLRQSQTVATIAVVGTSQLQVACILWRSTTLYPGSREVAVPSPKDNTLQEVALPPP